MEISVRSEGNQVVASIPDLIGDSQCEEDISATMPFLMGFFCGIVIPTIGIVLLPCCTEESVAVCYSDFLISALSTRVLFRFALIILLVISLMFVVYVWIKAKQKMLMIRLEHSSCLNGQVVDLVKSMLELQKPKNVKNSEKYTVISTRNACCGNACVSCGKGHWCEGVEKNYSCDKGAQSLSS